MVSAHDLQNQIIELVNKISDITQLAKIHAEVKSTLDSSTVQEKEDLPWKDAIVDMRETISFEDLEKEQGKKILPFEELRALTSKMEWDCSLDAVLDILD